MKSRQLSLKSPLESPGKPLYRPARRGAKERTELRPTRARPSWLAPAQIRLGDFVGNNLPRFRGRRDALLHN